MPCSKIFSCYNILIIGLMEPWLSKYSSNSARKVVWTQRTPRMGLVLAGTWVAPLRLGGVEAEVHQLVLALRRRGAKLGIRDGQERGGRTGG